MKTMQLHRNKNAPSEISSTHCIMPGPVSSFKWWRNGIFWSDKMFLLYTNILKMNKNAYFEMETLYVLENLILSFLKCNFYIFLKDCTHKKHFDIGRLISGFYLSCQKIILNSTGNLKLFWLIKIGSKISPWWLFLSFLRWLMIEKNGMTLPFYDQK